MVVISWCVYSLDACDIFSVPKINLVVGIGLVERDLVVLDILLDSPCGPIYAIDGNGVKLAEYPTRGVDCNRNAF